jgi:hypothetical protein
MVALSKFPPFPLFSLPTSLKQFVQFFRFRNIVEMVFPKNGSFFQNNQAWIGSDNGFQDNLVGIKKIEIGTGFAFESLKTIG